MREVGEEKTAREIALFIEAEHDEDRETISDFVLRNFGDQTKAVVFAALTMALERAQIRDEVAALLEIIVAKGGPDHAVLADLIAQRRKESYEPELEAILARRWRCPHCKQYATIQTGVLIPIGEPKAMPACAVCGEEGIAPIHAERPDLEAIDGGKP